MQLETAVEQLQARWHRSAARHPPLSALGGHSPAWPHGRKARPGFRGCPLGWGQVGVTAGGTAGLGAPRQLGGDELSG